MTNSIDAERAARFSHATGQNGFTLIEVLAALVIVALGMLGVIEAVSQTARNGTYLREKTLAHWIAMNVIAERRLELDPPPIAETSDEVEFANTRWRWTLTVSETPVENIRRLDVQVRAADAPKESALANLTGFYGSSLSPASGTPIAWSGSGRRDPDRDSDAEDESADPTQDPADSDEPPDPDELADPDESTEPEDDPE